MYLMPKQRMTWYLEDLVSEHSSAMFLVVCHKVCTHLRRDFDRLLCRNSLNPLIFSIAAWQLKASENPQIFYGPEFWRLARPLHDLNMLLFQPFLCFRSLPCWKTHP